MISHNDPLIAALTPAAIEAAIWRARADRAAAMRAAASQLPGLLKQLAARIRAAGPRLAGLSHDARLALPWGHRVIE